MAGVELLGLGARAPKAASLWGWLQTALRGGCSLQTCHLGTGPLGWLLPSECEPRVGGHSWAERPSPPLGAVPCCYRYCSGEGGRCQEELKACGPAGFRPQLRWPPDGAGR